MANKPTPKPAPKTPPQPQPQKNWPSKKEGHDSGGNRTVNPPKPKGK